MASIVERDDGYGYEDVAILWNRHITEAHDPFREKSGGLYDRIRGWVRANNLGWEQEIIDVCCGQGVTSVAASKLGPFVTGVDISEPLIEIARRENRRSVSVRFYNGNAADLYWIPKGHVFGGMMINGIFHLYPGVMEEAITELSRVTTGPVLITTVAPEANDFFAAAFANQIELMLDEDDPLGPTIAIIGNPTVNGPDGTKIVLRDTPFVQHPMSKLKRAFAKAGLEITNYETFGPVSDVGGPEGLNLFAEIHLEHQKV